MTLNSVNIMGDLTRDPELKYTPSGKSTTLHGILCMAVAALFFAICCQHLVSDDKRGAG